MKKENKSVRKRKSVKERECVCVCMCAREKEREEKKTACCNYRTRLGCSGSFAGTGGLSVEAEGTYGGARDCSPQGP